MKAKLAAAVLFLAVILSVPACTPAEPGPLKILIDMGTVTDRKKIDNFTEDLIDYSQAYGGSKEIEVEVLSSIGATRETAIERIHTEIMAGEGPDVFLIANANNVNAGDNGVFPIPEKAMEDGIFLPLDDYMENNSQFTDWDNQIELILAAGRTAAGQVILPISFHFPVTCFRQEEVPNNLTKETTWADMFANESGAFRVSGTWYHSNAWYFDRWQGDNLNVVLGKLADFEEETLAFTPEELLQRANEILDLQKRYDEGEFRDVPDHYQLYLNTGYDRYMNFYRYSVIGNHENLTMVPVYSDDGGTTAVIVSYVAINANTLQPDNAFLIADLLLSTAMQRSSATLGLAISDVGMPVQADLGSQRLRKTGLQGWEGFSEANFEEYCRVREQITNVQFQSLLTQELDNFYGKLQMAETNGQDPAQLAAEAYAAMERALKE